MLRRTALALMAIALLVAASAQPAQGAPPPTMTGEDFYALGPLPTGDRQFLIDCRSNADGTQTYTYEASGPTTGPYPGSSHYTFVETGEFTIRPKPPNPGIPVGPADVLSLNAEFTVDSETGQVSGSKRLAAPVEDGASYGGCGGQCEPVIETRLSDLNYAATITTTSGLFADRGRATFSTTLREGFGSCRVHEFRESFTSSLASPEQQGSILFGSRSPGSSFSAMSANAKRASPFTLYFPATVRKLHAYVEGDFFNRRDSQVLRGVLYARGPDGGPGTRVGQTFQFTVPGGMSPRWLVLYMAPPVRLNPGVYWIGIHSGATGGVARFAWDPRDNSRRFNVDYYPDGPSNPFGAAALDNQGMSIFASGSY